MASLAIVTEYQSAVINVGGTLVQVIQEPPLAEQTVDFTAGATATANPFKAATSIVRIKCNAAASLSINNTGTAATTANQVLGAGETEYKGVPPGQNFKASFITAAAGF